jgi:hypothetical protein
MSMSGSLAQPASAATTKMTDTLHMSLSMPRLAGDDDALDHSSSEVTPASTSSGVPRATTLPLSSRTI